MINARILPQGTSCRDAVRWKPSSSICCTPWRKEGASSWSARQIWMSSLSIPDAARDIRAATASNGSGAGMDLEVLAFGKTRACTGKAREGELCDKNDPGRLWQGILSFLTDRRHKASSCGGFTAPRPLWKDSAVALCCARTDP